MNPTKVWARNFRTYETVDWDIPSGLSAVLGHNLVSEGSDSNGSGKSSLLELLPIALFGPGLPWSEYLTAGGDAETPVTPLTPATPGTLVAAGAP